MKRLQNRFASLVALVALCCMLSNQFTRAGCDITQFHQADTLDQCTCVNNSCVGPTKDVRNSRYYCVPAPPTVKGQEGSPVKVAARSGKRLPIIGLGQISPIR